MARVRTSRQLPGLILTTLVDRIATLVVKRKRALSGRAEETLEKGDRPVCKFGRLSVGSANRVIPDQRQWVGVWLDAPGDVVEAGDVEIRVVEEIGIGIGIGEPFELVADLRLQPGPDLLTEVLRQQGRGIAGQLGRVRHVRHSGCRDADRSGSYRSVRRHPGAIGVPGMESGEEMGWVASSRSLQSEGTSSLRVHGASLCSLSFSVRSFLSAWSRVLSFEIASHSQKMTSWRKVPSAKRSSIT